MTDQQFVYWLQGFVELQETDRPSEQQWTIIKDHLQLVFSKETPNRRPWGDQVVIKDTADFTTEVPTFLLKESGFPANTIIC
jgi:hypothetical protein